MSPFTAAGPIVVGVNGSTASLAALRWATAQARLLGVPVVVVHVWERSKGTRAPYASVARRTAAEELAGAEQVLGSALAAARTSEGSPPDVRGVLVEGSPVSVLLRHAQDALVLALGRRISPVGTPSPAAPVVRDCLRTAPCPVITVPEPVRHSVRADLAAGDGAKRRTRPVEQSERTTTRAGLALSGHGSRADR